MELKSINLELTEWKCTWQYEIGPMYNVNNYLYIC